MTHFVPVKHLYKLAELIKREHGFDVISMWKDQGLSLPDDPAEFTKEEDFRLACKLAVDHVDDPVLGLKFGKTISLIQMGPLGAAMMSCNTAKESLALALDFKNGFVPNSFYTREEGDSLLIYPSLPESHKAYNQFDLQVFSMALVHSIKELSHSSNDSIIVHFDFAEPDSKLLHCYNEYLAVTLVFNQEQPKLIFPISLLETSLPGSDSISKTSFINACQNTQERLFAREALSHRIFKLLDNKGIYPSLDELADQLNYSTRKLRYQLKKEGTSFRKLLSHHRLRRALELLDNSDTPIKTISDMVGYQDLPSFYRSFKKELGINPAEWRNKHK